MSIYGRALAYFTPDWKWILALVGLIAVSVCVGLLEAWPLAVLIDSVLTREPKGGTINRIFLSIIPESKVGQIIGLVLIGMGLQVLGYLAWMGRTMINYHLNYRGTTRVRYDLFTKLQQLGLTFHRGHPQGDAIYRLTTDAFGPWSIMDTVIGTSVAGVTLIVMTAILLDRNVPLTAAAFAVAPFMIWSNWRFGVRILHVPLLPSKLTPISPARFSRPFHGSRWLRRFGVSRSSSGGSGWPSAAVSGLCYGSTGRKRSIRWHGTASSRSGARSSSDTEGIWFTGTSFSIRVRAE